MSNRDEQDTDRKKNEATPQQSWQQRHGALLLLVGFAVLMILMVVMRKVAQ